MLRLGPRQRWQFSEFNAVPTKQITTRSSLSDHLFDRANATDKPELGDGEQAVVFFSAKMKGAEFSRRHFDLAFTDNFKRQVEIESGDWATIIPFRPKVQITGQDCYRRIKSLSVAIGVAKSVCQNGVPFVFQKLGRMGRAIDRSFDSQDILLGWILWCENLPRQCSGSVLAIASKHILPDGAISGWDRPFRRGGRGAKHYAKQNRKEPRHTIG